MASKEPDELLYQHNFRDSLGNITRAGKRLKIYPRRPGGSYHSARRIVSLVLLLFLFAAPFIKIDGHPFLLFNILERKFVLFGLPFWPQDFHLFLLCTLALVVAIVLFTAVFGRLWCGWACPQTIFMEMLFRKIEYWIEGNASSQRRLDQSPWTARKTFKKGLKHSLFFAISFAIANIFLAYIISVEELWKIVTDPPQQHLQGLASITIFSLVFYGVFARFREQACIVVCPYGRFQSVMVNQDTIAVTYDYKRGEPRLKLKHPERAPSQNNGEFAEPLQKHGDCIDCKLCVQVCPTGIDIRNGIQMECINCTACMDACDEVMEKVERPKKLIRYSSYRDIEESASSKWWNPRIVAYAAVLLALLASSIYLFSTRASVQAVILREPGQLYNELPGAQYSNFYSVKIINKTFEPIPVEIRLDTPEAGVITFLGEIERVPAQAILEGRFYLALPSAQLRPGRNPVRFAIYADGAPIETVDSSFLAPHNLATKGRQ